MRVAKSHQHLGIGLGAWPINHLLSDALLTRLCSRQRDHKLTVSGWSASSPTHQQNSFLCREDWTYEAKQHNTSIHPVEPSEPVEPHQPRRQVQFRDAHEETESGKASSKPEASHSEECRERLHHYDHRLERTAPGTPWQWNDQASICFRESLRKPCLLVQSNSEFPGPGEANQLMLQLTLELIQKRR